MLTTEQIDVLRGAGERLPLGRTNALALAAAHRTLPVYQAYSEGPFGATGHGLAHDAMVQAWRVLRARPGASREGLLRTVEDAVDLAQSDLESIHRADDFGLVEGLVVESVSAAVLALGSVVSGDRESAVGAMLAAIEVDLVWAEGRSDAEGGPVSFDDVLLHHGRQVRDVELLSRPSETDENILFRDLAMRAEREGMPYLVGMRQLLVARSDVAEDPVADPAPSVRDQHDRWTDTPFRPRAR